MSDKSLTKSLFTIGKKCHKALYLHTHSFDLKPPTTSLEHKMLGAGNEVGQAARNAFPDGILIKPVNTTQALHETQQAIDTGALRLYEAAFTYDDVLIRVDILSRDAVDKPWDFYEVKATTYNNCTKEEKEEYRSDIAIQVWVLKHLGIPLRQICLMHLNKECRYPNLDNLFACQDYSLEIENHLSQIEHYLRDMRHDLSLEDGPKIDIGPHCDTPLDCPFKNYCKKDLPKPSIFNIPRNLKKWKQYERGVISTDDLEMADFNTASQKRALQCYKDKRPFFDKKTVYELLNLWEYPLAYLDFEAIDYPIPRYPGARPYQHIPFQFSCHIQNTADADLEHVEFLWASPSDPRPAFIRELLEKVPSKGSIIVYNESYESTRLKELAEDFPEYEDDLLDIRARLVDLMKIVKKGVYYPEFMGSFSIKKVAPAMLGKSASYDGLEVSDGVEAALSFDLMTLLPNMSEEKNTIQKNMLEYCHQDTLVMVNLHKQLQDMLSENISSNNGS